MSEDEEVQSGAPAEGAGAGVGGGTGGTKTVVAVIVVLVILAALALVYAKQGGFRGGVSEEQGTGFGEAQFGDGVTGGNAAEGEAPSGTIIDNGAGFTVDAPEGQAQSFDLTAKNFEFSLKEIRVKIGDTVRVNVTSTEGTHNWKVDEFSATTETVNQGGTSAVIFTADKAGEFEYYCGIGSHRSLGMVGTLIVEE
ncbi:MAG: cupredoxin domain-containing protein [Parcubacteria group bacterium]|nr:cupredoxin domain-containing protein [Parcubacteria group bacterium]